jgi:hypothetical protein
LLTYGQEKKGQQKWPPLRYSIAAPIFDAWVEINEDNVDNNAK